MSNPRDHSEFNHTETCAPKGKPFLRKERVDKADFVRDVLSSILPVRSLILPWCKFPCYANARLLKTLLRLRYRGRLTRGHIWMLELR